MEQAARRARHHRHEPRGDRRGRGQPPGHPDRRDRRYELRPGAASTIPIAGNDDAIRSIRVILQKLVDAHRLGAASEASKSERRRSQPSRSSRTGHAADLVITVLDPDSDSGSSNLPKPSIPSHSVPWPKSAPHSSRQLRDKTNAGMMDCKRRSTKPAATSSKAEEHPAQEGHRQRGQRRPVAPPRKASSPPTSTCRARSACSSRSTARPTSWRRTKIFREFVKDITLHIAAASPRLCQPRAGAMPTILSQRTRHLPRRRCRASPRTSSRRSSMAKSTNFTDTFCLLEQAFIKNPDQTVKDLREQQDCRTRRKHHHPPLRPLHGGRGHRRREERGLKRLVPQLAFESEIFVTRSFAAGLASRFAPPTPFRSLTSARAWSSGSRKERAAERCNSVSSRRSCGVRSGGRISARFSSMARSRRAIWMLELPNCRISVTARWTKSSQSGVG